MFRLVAAIAALSFAMPAQADWHVAESDHFVVYADDSEKDVRRFSEMLERYHAAMEFVTGREAETPSPSNRVTVYAVGGKRQIRELAGEPSTLNIEAICGKLRWKRRIPLRASMWSLQRSV